MMKYTIYKTTNLINGKFYIGQHITEDVNDSYLGSGTYLFKAINKYGKNNFKKDILFIFDNFDDMNNKEIEIVDKYFVVRGDNYNLSIGGHNPRYNIKTNKNRFNAIDKDGNIINIFNDDPKFLSGELRGIAIGTVAVRDIDNNIFKVSTNDPRFLSGELVCVTKNRLVSKEQREKLRAQNSNMVVCKNKITGEELYISKSKYDKDDNIVGRSYGIKINLSDESRENIAITHRGKNNNNFKGYWIYKSFREESANSLAKLLNTGSTGIKRWCKTNKVINNKSYSKSLFLQSLGSRESIVGKTTYDLGFGFEQVNG